MRERSTWAADRKASAPPATPGYGAEDQDHPAHQPDPAYEAYQQGDPDAWAETPKAPPYPQGNPPADPGYDVEDQDHPAHINPPRNPKNSSLKAQVEKKAAKCIRVARVMLGCDATSQMVEDQALDLMDVPEDNLDSMYARMSGGFLAEEVVQEPEVEDEGIAALLEDEETPVMARIRAVEDELNELKRAGQNAPGGSQNNANEEQVRQMLASWDTDNDGFLAKEDWQGSPKLFVQADLDGDGFVTLDEAMTPFFDEDDDPMLDDPMGIDPMLDDPMGVDPMLDDPMFDDLGLDEEEAALMAELESQIACGPTASKKAEDDELEEEEAPAKKAVAKKVDDDEDSDEEPKEEEAHAEEESKEASDAAMFSVSGDPLADMTGGEDALLAEIFGGKTAKKADDDADDDAAADDADDDADEPKEEEAPAEELVEEEGDKKEGGKKKASAQHPARPKTASGVKTLGTQVRTAGKSEINDLAKLWETSPDVHEVFGLPKNNG